MKNVHLAVLRPAATNPMQFPQLTFFLNFFQVRLQTMPVPGPGQAPLYAGAMDCVKKTVKAEGFFKGLYKGMMES